MSSGVPSHWLALTHDAAPENIEAVTDAWLAAGALSVDVTDAHAGGELEVPVFAEPQWNSDARWSLARVTVLLGADADTSALLQSVCEQAGVAVMPPAQVERIDDQDWVRATQSQFEPVQVSARMWIVPSWHTPPAADAINLRLDPGLAFGTGSHPTTWQCLRWLDAHLLPGQRVLDYGCGSGILAIAAAKLGGVRVVGTDIDPQALLTANDNANTNGVEIAWLAPEALPPRADYDVVVANILANPLRALAPLLCAQLRPGGHLILAGILDRQAEEVIQAFAPWVSLTPFEPREGWTSLIGTRHIADQQ